MNRTSRTVRLASAIAAFAITGALFQTVTSFSRPTAIEQLALAKKSTVTVAGIVPAAAATSRTGAR